MRGTEQERSSGPSLHSDTPQRFTACTFTEFIVRNVVVLAGEFAIPPAVFVDPEKDLYRGMSSSRDANVRTSPAVDLDIVGLYSCLFDECQEFSRVRNLFPPNLFLDTRTVDALQCVQRPVDAVYTPDNSFTFLAGDVFALDTLFSVQSFQLEKAFQFLYLAASLWGHPLQALTLEHELLQVNCLVLNCEFVGNLFTDCLRRHCLVKRNRRTVVR